MKLYKHILLGITLFTTIYGQNENKAQIVKKPLELSILAMQNGKVFNEEWSIFQEAFKDTNVKLKSYSSKNISDEIQAFNLAISSGKLPDIITLAYPQKLESLGMDGGLIPLNDLINEHAPNIKKFFEKYPKYKKAAKAADGNIYFMPSYYDWYEMKVSQALFIRKDWLDKLNLKTPETMKDFYNVMKAFKTQDPNGNGKADEVPYFERVIEFADKELLGLFGAEFGFYLDGDMIKYGPTSERFKEAMPEVIKWYKEGLIDQEIFTRGFQGRDYMLRNDLGGITFDWITSTSAYNVDTELKKQNKDFEFVAVTPPEYKGGRFVPDARYFSTGGWGISATTKNSVEIIKYFDYWFSEKGNELFNWGVEGNTFVRDENGKKMFTDKVMKNKDKSPMQVLLDEGIQFNRVGAQQDYEYEKALGNPQSIEWAEKYMKEGYVVDPMPTLKYLPKESRKIQKINSQLGMVVGEMSQKWILGAEDFEKTYPQFIKRLNDMGLQEALEINQKAYDRFNKD
ncbi:extracellular solute-binding protein [uncultured Cetobacterium sp.]|uniref:extracellular solute-binding protein n=1 Tax=uncultured Cetobacterium sp. TaxID=527638 RepID=UPI0026021449|nr:extracellular solute-binding protein [uncultured Cetobacterium sp.]